jgi:hypothetical protein
LGLRRSAGAVQSSRDLISKQAMAEQTQAFYPNTQSQSYRMYIPEIAREITSCWISAVPSKMS